MKLLSGHSLRRMEFKDGDMRIFTFLCDKEAINLLLLLLLLLLMMMEPGFKGVCDPTECISENLAMSRTFVTLSRHDKTIRSGR